MDELRSAVTTRWVSRALVATIALLGCVAEERAPDSSPRPEEGIVAVPAPAPSTDAERRPATLDDKLTMFRQGLMRPEALSGGAPTRETLIRRFVAAIEHRDTAAVRAMVVDRAEFAWLYYPSSAYTRPPRLQEAPLAWFLMVENSQKGITRAFNRLGGSGVSYRGHQCDAAPAIETRNRFWRGCVVTVRGAESRGLTLRLFGSIIERDGQFKFLSYANDF